MINGKIVFLNVVILIWFKEKYFFFEIILVISKKCLYL